MLMGGVCCGGVEGQRVSRCFVHQFFVNVCLPDGLLFTGSSGGNTCSPHLSLKHPIARGSVRALLGPCLLQLLECKGELLI